VKPSLANARQRKEKCNMIIDREKGIVNFTGQPKEDKQANKMVDISLILIFVVAVAIPWGVCLFTTSNKYVSMIMFVCFIFSGVGIFLKRFGEGKQANKRRNDDYAIRANLTHIAQVLINVSGRLERKGYKLEVIMLEFLDRGLIPGRLYFEVLNGKKLEIISHSIYDIENFEKTAPEVNKKPGEQQPATVGA